MSPRSKRLLARLIFWAGFCLVFLILCEVFVRLCFGRAIVLYPRFHEAAAYGPYQIRRLRPNTVFRHQSVDGAWEFRINSQGFRDDHDYAYFKPPGVLRVLCLGDSHTEGFECAQRATYPQVLERYARARGYEVEVMNTGVSGFGTAEQLVFLENEGARYHPDVVVVGYFANDPDDNAKSDLFRIKAGALATNKLEHLPGVKASRPFNNLAVTRWLSQHSYAYSLVMNWIWDTMKVRLSRQAARAVPAEFAVAQAAPDKSVEAYQWQLTGLLVRRLHEFCRANGMRLFIVDIPCRESPESFRSSIPPALAPVMREHSERVFWSTNVFADYQNAVSITVPHGQWHLSELGHAQIGIALAREIIAQAPAKAAGDSSAKR